MNSTEWEMTLHLHDFDEFWMRYAAGKGLDIVIPNSRFKDVISISAVLRNNSEIFHNFENSQFLRHHVWHDALKALPSMQLNFKRRSTLEFIALFHKLGLIYAPCNANGYLKGYLSHCNFPKHLLQCPGYRAINSL